MDLFSALAEPRRREILKILSLKGELSATDISDKFQVSPPAISQHLKVLREVKLVQMEKRAQQRIYKVNPKTVHELENWAKKMAQAWDRRFNVLDRVLEVEKRKNHKKTI